MGGELTPVTNIPRSVCYSEPLNHGWVSSYQRGSVSAVSHQGWVELTGCVLQEVRKEEHDGPFWL